MEKGTKITPQHHLCKLEILHLSANMYENTSDGFEPRLGSACAIFQKARVEKNGKNEPIWGLFKNSIWKSLILTKKDKFLFLQ